MSIVYKTLFEIKLMHEYYLTRGDGSTVFELPDQQDRLNFLAAEFKDNQKPVNDDISFEFPEDLQSDYRGLHLRILPTYSGCKVAVRVRPERLSDNTLVFQPFVSLPVEREVFVLIIGKTGALDLLTNSRIRRYFPASYFFSNDGATGLKVFPYLTNGIPLQDASVAYEQGELSMSGSDIQEYYPDGGGDKWRTVEGMGFANENDRILLPSRFEYAFSDTDNLTEATFQLKDLNGNTVASILKNDPTGLGNKVSLDFSEDILALYGVGGSPSAPSAYTLSVTGGNGLSAEHEILISSELTRKSPWGVVAIRPVVADNAFRLIANDGFLLNRKDPSGIWTPAPVFEIPVKSRLTYLRYIHNRGRELNVSVPLTDYVNKEGNVLVTKLPRAVTRSWFFLRKEASNDTQYSPGPVFPELRVEADRRFFFNVTISQSDLFPEAP